MALTLLELEVARGRNVSKRGERERWAGYRSAHAVTVTSFRASRKCHMLVER